MREPSLANCVQLPGSWTRELKRLRMTYATIADLTADRVVYRDLEPYDRNLPQRAELLARAGLPPELQPRKREPAYARLLVELARAAQQLRNGPDLQTLLVIGDTENDRQLTRNLQQLAPLQAWGFFGVDRLDQPAACQETDGLTNANRWSLIADWASDLRRTAIDWERCAVLLDIDKTILGPRGRSDQAIDAARAEGAVQVASDLCSAGFDPVAFGAIYADLCRDRWHPFTGDNQDYVVLAALMVLQSELDPAGLAADIDAGNPPRMAQLLETAAERVPPKLGAVFHEARELITQGDPTPFKQFRRAEFGATIARMRDGSLPLCTEVVAVTQALAAQGALCLAASDKPAESALPEASQRDRAPLHRTPARLDT
jgi:hypothetical protein